MFLAVILRGARALRNRHNHFVRDRRDFQLAFGRGNRVVDRLRIAVQLVGERVLALANVRLRARHLVRRALAFNKAVAAYRHRVVRQRRAVVLFAVSSGGQRHLALADRQRSRIRLRNDILSCSVNRVKDVFREVRRIGVSIRSRHANVDRAEISVFRRSGKAGNALLRSIISLRVAVRRQRDVLIIVEVKNVIAIDNRERRFLTRNQRVARNIGVRGHSFAERRSSCYGVFIFNLFLCSVQIIVYRVSGGVLFIVERQRIRLFFKRDCLRLGMTIHRKEGIGIFIILPGSRGCNVLIRFLPHIARLVIRTDHFFSIIIDILYRINGRNLSNINLSVHVPC